MRACVFSDGSEIALGRFVEAYVRHVCCGIVAALRTEQPAESILLELDGDAVNLHVDGRPISLSDNRGFATAIIRDTVRGVTGKLKGITPGAKIRIEVNLSRTEGI